MKARHRPMEWNITRTQMRCAALAVVMLCCGDTGASFAQMPPGMTRGAPATRTAAGTGMGTGASMQPQPGMPIAAPRPGTATLTMGGILLNLGNLAAPSQIGALGTITPCLAPGIAISPTSTPTTAAFDAANGIVLPTPAGSTPAFGTISLSSICNPITPGSPADSTALPDPNAATAFVDGALPLTSVEGSSPGMSPSIVVPPPAVASPMASRIAPSALAVAGNNTGSSSTILSATDLGATDLTATDVGAMDVGTASGGATSSQMATEPPPALYSADVAAPVQ
jgi:hypothetical protein